MSAPPRRPDASMTLLTSMMERPLDPGYAAAAARRQAEGRPAQTSLRSVRLAAATVALGLVIGIGGSALRTSASANSAARSGLVGQIEDARAVTDGRTQQVQELRVAVSGLQAGLAGGADAQLPLLEAAAGAVAVQGPGFVVTLDDAPTSAVRGQGLDPRDLEQSQGTVMAVDVQTLVNGLWQAGAEAISINGQRLTSTSAIRFAGQAILVDFRPLARPYVISAIGDSSRLPANFADGPAGTYAATLVSTYGIVVKTEVADQLDLPAANTLTTRHAQAVADIGDTGSASSPQESERSP